MEAIQKLEKIIERKKKYLLQLEEKKSAQWLINSVQSEINLLFDCIDEINENKNFQSVLNKMNEEQIESLETKCFKLEVIAFIHGIDNLKEQMNKSTAELITKYRYTRNENFRFYPVQFIKLN